MLDLSKPYQRRDGNPCEILATDLSGEFPIVAKHTTLGSNGRTFIRFHRVDGRSYPDSDLSDIVNVVETRTFWVNVYPNTLGDYHFTRESADMVDATQPRLGVLRVDITDGKVVTVYEPT